VSIAVAEVVEELVAFFLERLDYNLMMGMILLGFEKNMQLENQNLNKPISFQMSEHPY
jgi:hypothetical protein